MVDGNEVRKIVLMPDRDLLRARIANRFARMMDDGAVEEVKQLLEQALDPALPAMKAIGVREIGAFLKGEISADKTVELAAIATRQYAKRQMTWFRNQLGNDWKVRGEAG